MKKALTSADAKTLILSIIKDKQHFLIIGQGALYRKMKAYLFGRYRLDVSSIHNYSSFDAPVNNQVLYIVAASPTPEVCEILINKGVKKESIIPWLSLLDALESEQDDWLIKTYGLLPLEDSEKPYIHKQQVTFDADVFLHIKKALQKWLLVNDTFAKSNQSNLVQIEQLSSIYLKLRLDLFQQTSIPVKKLLFPSAGRCGGTSITSALQSIALNLHVSHEGYSTEIYNLLKSKYQFGYSEQVMLAITSIILDESDCLGGNPICFLLPYVSSLQWFECAVIKVNRTKSDLISSIVDRNFHYSERDFAPNRLTADTVGEMSHKDWVNLTRIEKVDWYIDQVDRAIYQNKTDFAFFYDVEFSELGSVLSEVLNTFSWSNQEINVSHLNSLPKDKIYSFEERIKLFAEKNFDSHES
ncbi:hypothetical protein [Thalassotalea marina]|uniref:Uncharacterized protein n=1 Tax=Thalassotalea marina TaxID=1673741 RepID=A0A919EGM9_9GAMM|nr:hypothetical protein [Thalassotalea marina]GHF80475.1 hypothetical protein GCM10017161_04710 [Thalassotalea marina]